MKKWKNAVRTWEQTELSKLTWEQKKSIGRA